MTYLNSTYLNDEVLRDIIRFCKPKDLKLSDINITFKDGSYMHANFDSETKEIVIYIPTKRPKYPINVYRRPALQKEGYASGFSINSFHEGLVYFISHELGHLLQAKKTLKEMPRMGIKKDKWSESHCEIFALKKLDNWRKRNKLNRVFTGS